MQQPSGTTFQRNPRRAPNMDMGASICEVIGRLGIHEAQEELVELLLLVASTGSVVREAVLTSLSFLPPEKVPKLWNLLKEGKGVERERLAAIFKYLYNPSAVPFLIDVLEHQDLRYMANVARPLLLRLGALGEPSALPFLNRIARDERHPERATALKAIQLLMKQAEGQEEVTLLRGSSAETLDQDVLLRASGEAPDAINPNELLRSTAQEITPSSATSPSTEETEKAVNS